MDVSAPLANYTNKVMESRFSDVMWLIDQVMWKSFDKRLADFLLNEANIEGTNILKITHETIGNHLGNPREVVNHIKLRRHLQIFLKLIVICSLMSLLVLWIILTMTGFTKSEQSTD